MPDLIPFQYKTHEVRIDLDSQHTPWWVAADVGGVLDYANISSVLKRLDDDEKGIRSISTLGGVQELWCVNEAGLYTLILGSKKAEAKPFKRWVTHEVLPTIRATGRYEITTPQVKDPAIQMLIDMAIRLDEARSVADEAKAQAQQAQDAAIQALHGQQWLTIRQYVAIYRLDRQLPKPLQAQYGKWLTGYCLEKGLPVYENRSANGWEEHTYPIWSIQTTLDTWLARRHGQAPLAILPSSSSKE
jgi:prophage antirepressor-like protein